MAESVGDLRVPVGAANEATMMDTGERDRPPGDPPDGRGSWVEKVVGNVGGGMMRPENVLNDDFVRERMGLEFPDGEDGEPVVTIEREVLEAMNGLWKRCMIVKVLGRNISISVVSRKLRELWKPKGAMHVMDLPRHFFMVRFDEEEEYLAALTGGPWRVFGSYLLVQAWSPEFDPLRDEITTTPVWVRLSNIPVNFYHRSILLGIARGLGKPVKVDLTTLNFERARFARVCVEVNLQKPLKGTIMVNGERYCVAYEGLANICSLCGIYGHLVHSCPKRVVENSLVVPSNQRVEKTSTSREKQVEEGFTLVRRNNRRPEQEFGQPTVSVGTAMGRNLRDITKGKDSGNIATSNRFGNLVEDMVVSEIEGSAMISGANKENVIFKNQGKEAQSVGQGKELGVGASGSFQKGLSGEALKAKRAGVNGPVVKNGPRPKVVKQNKPTRGLVFGPMSGEGELSTTGKRLRVENHSVGRRGGVFSAELGSGLANVSAGNGLIGGEGLITSSSGDGSGQMEIAVVDGRGSQEPVPTTA